jgi:hypothetical protein
MIRASVASMVSVFMLVIAGQGSGSQTIEEQLKLQAGNYWIYKGKVAWADESKPAHEGSDQITWKVKILEATVRGDLKAYVVNGSFDDLTWYSPGKKPDQYLWIVYKNRFYTKLLNTELRERVRDPLDDLTSVIEGDQPVLQFPLQLNQCTTELKREDSGQREDLRYCWYLSGRSRQPLGVKSFTRRRVTTWTASYQTAPDDQILSFAPGVGFVAYDFSHHGTIAEAHVKLVEAHLR